MGMNIEKLTQLVAAIAPIHGLNSNGVISFKDEATAGQITAAQAFVDANIGSLSNEVIPSITTRQFLIAAASAGLITWAEAKTSAPPAAIQAVFDTLPDLQKKAAEVTWARMTMIERNEPLVAGAAAAFGMNEAQIDTFFIQAAAI